MTARYGQIETESPHGKHGSASPLGAITAALDRGAVVGGRYEVEAMLASGGMGEVYRVRHVELRKRFALKVMRAALCGSAEFEERFKREVIASSRIGHPNIVDITDFGRMPGGRFYFVMEHLEGLTLRELLANERPLQCDRVLALVRQLCAGLGAAHRDGIIHRDLKPDNVMVVQRPGLPEKVKVLDFGLAKLQLGSGLEGTTLPGTLMGTPQYMSPEQAGGRAVDCRSDIYSVGVVFYELLAGVPPFSADTPPQLMLEQIRTPPPPLPPTIAKSTPDHMVRAVFAMLEKDPAARPQTMEQALRLLDGRMPAAVDVTAEEAKNAPLHLTSLRRHLVTGLVVSALAGICIGGAIQHFGSTGVGSTDRPTGSATAPAAGQEEAAKPPAPSRRDEVVVPASPASGPVEVKTAEPTSVPSRAAIRVERRSSGLRPSPRASAPALPNETRPGPPSSHELKDAYLPELKEVK